MKKVDFKKANKLAAEIRGQFDQSMHIYDKQVMSVQEQVENLISQLNGILDSTYEKDCKKDDYVQFRNTITLARTNCMSAFYLVTYAKMALGSHYHKKLSGEGVTDTEPEIDPVNFD